MLKRLLRKILTVLFRVEVRGEENLHGEYERVMVIANHTSLLDAVLLYAYLPVSATYAINTYVAKSRAGRIGSRFASLFPLDPANPLSIRALIRRVKEGGWLVIFPEGRITVTGALMKFYHGPGMVADRAQAVLLPIRIDGAQYTPFSRMRGRVRSRWFPKVTLNILPPRNLVLPEGAKGRERRELAGKVLADLMTELMFESESKEMTLIDRLLEARNIHGGQHIIAEDIKRDPLSYNALITRLSIIGKYISGFTQPGEMVGLLLPSSLATINTFWGMQLYGRVPAMLNYTVGPQGMVSACETAKLKRVITSRYFIEQAKLETGVEALAEHVELIYLEDVAGEISKIDKLSASVLSRFDWWLKSRSVAAPDERAVVLFTSGSEGTPKGVVLSHRNLLSNIQQLTTRIDFSGQDIALNTLPLFHSFGLTAGTLLTLTSGVRTFFYPSPLHYRVVPEVAYDINATLMFGTNTFLAGYARFAHPYDFYSLRYVFAGAEKLQEEVRRTWETKFGVRIFEGYGATETSPVISANTPMDNKPNSVGKFMPGIEYRLTEVPGLDQGARLSVRGPNIMLGYLLHDQPAVLVPPETELGAGWYDTGDIVVIDEDGFIQICGRAKRFAKVAGEMVSLTSVEMLASKTWPKALHAALAIPDLKKGEQVILLTTEKDAVRTPLSDQAKLDGVAELAVPRKVISIATMPVLGTGKIDYVGAQRLLEQL